MDDVKLKGMLDHLGHLIRREEIRRVFKPRDVYGHRNWTLDGSRTGEVLEFGVSLGRLARRKVSTKGRPSVLYFFRVPDPCAPLPGELDALGVDRIGNVERDKLYQGITGIYADAEPPPYNYECGCLLPGIWWRIRSTVGEWGPWHHAADFPVPEGYGGDLETTGPTAHEINPHDTMSAERYDAALKARAMPDRFDGRGLPRFFQDDACPHHPEGRYEMLQSSNANPRWRCMGCYGEFSDSIKMEMGRWLVQAGEPGQVEFLRAGRSNAGMAAALGTARVHHD